jgi:hypothetical protein
MRTPNVLKLNPAVPTERYSFSSQAEVCFSVGKSDMDVILLRPGQLTPGGGRKVPVRPESADSVDAAES